MELTFFFTSVSTICRLRFHSSFHFLHSFSFRQQSSILWLALADCSSGKNPLPLNGQILHLRNLFSEHSEVTIIFASEISRFFQILIDFFSPFQLRLSVLLKGEKCLLFFLFPFFCGIHRTSFIFSISWMRFSYILTHLVVLFSYKT